MQPWVSLWTPTMYVSILINCCAFSRKMFFCLLCLAIVFSAVPITELFLSTDPTYLSVSRRGIPAPRRFPLVIPLCQEHCPDWEQLLTASWANTCRNLPGAAGGVQNLHSVWLSFWKLKWADSSGNCCGKVRGSSSRVILLFERNSESLEHLLFQTRWHGHLGMRQVQWRVWYFQILFIGKDYF